MNYPESFVCARKEYSTFEQHVNAPCFRKRFFLDAMPEQAAITISGLGFYDLFINGKKITKGYLAPYISNPDDIVYFDRYDVLPYLQTGENVVGVLLGNGIQNCPGGQVWDFEKARFRSSPKFALSFQADAGGSAVLTFGADEGFVWADSPILFDDLRCGVIYDARLELDGWAAPGFDDAAWRPVIPAEKPRGEYRLCEAEPIVKEKELRAVGIEKGRLIADYKPRADIHFPQKTPYFSDCREGYVYDFGVNTAGVPCLRIKGEPGQKIELQFCEYYDKNGLLSYQNLYFYPECYVQRDVYICRGKGEELFIPPFTYHGARYCMVMGITPQQATQDLLQFYVLHSDLTPRGDFSCSDETANKLQQCGRVSDLSNFFYFPTDCPHREKNGWTGDAAVSAEHMTLNLSPENSYREWMRNIRAAQLADGRIPGIVPTSGWGFAWGNGPAWDQVIVQLPYQTYLYRGETEMITENADLILRYLHYLTTRKSADGTIAIGLGDWCQVGRGSGDPVIPLAFTDTVIAMDICRKAAFLFGVVGMEPQKAFADALAADFRMAVRTRLVDLSSATVYGNCQTGQAMAIYYDVFEGAEKRAAFDVLMQLIKEKGEHFDAGMLGVRVLFHVLAAFGETDLAFRMITRPDHPSYGNWIAHGATSLWEDFQNPDTWARPNSLNHHFMGDISNFFITKVAGLRINPHLDDPCHIHFAPSLIPSLTNAAAHYDTPRGRASIDWTRTEREGTLSVVCPQGVTGSVLLPHGWVFAGQDSLNGKAVAPAASRSYPVRRSHCH